MRFIFISIVFMIFASLSADQNNTLNTSFDFTAKEKAWIKKNRTIRFTGDPNWLPFEAFDNNGKYIGIVADLLDLIEERAGLQMHRIPTKNWNDSVKYLRSEKVDMLSETTDSPLRNKFDFTDSFLTNPIVIVMQKNHRHVNSISAISDQKIALIKGYGYISKIEKQYPSISFYKVENIQDGLSGVSDGKYDAMVCTMALGGYTITQMELNNISIVGETGFSTKLAFAVRRDYPELISILNKVLKSIDLETMQNILFKWVTFKYVEKVNYTLLYQIAFFAFLVISGTLFWNRRLKQEISRRTELQQEVDTANRLLTDSLEFASLIQQAIIPEDQEFDDFFDDHMTIWEPRDIVGGDIYFLNPLRNDDEIVLMVIDCTGHGVPGAFVTMSVKAIERQMISYILNNDQDVSPADLLGVFNRSIKHLLKQQDKSSISNAGFDAGILYINKRVKRALFAGAHIGLFYIQDGSTNYIKGNRHSIGYKTSNPDYRFEDHEISLDSTITFYLTSDGYIEQNGGNKGFPMGKNRFKKIITEHHNEPMHQQKEILIKELKTYQGALSRNDDITVVGVVINAEEEKS